MLCPMALRATVLNSTPLPGEQSAVIDMALLGFGVPRPIFEATRHESCPN